MQEIVAKLNVFDSEKLIGQFSFVLNEKIFILPFSTRKKFDGSNDIKLDYEAQKTIKSLEDVGFKIVTENIDTTINDALEKLEKKRSEERVLKAEADYKRSVDFLNVVEGLKLLIETLKNRHSDFSFQLKFPSLEEYKKQAADYPYSSRPLVASILYENKHMSRSIEVEYLVHERKFQFRWSSDTTLNRGISRAKASTVITKFANSIEEHILKQISKQHNQKIQDDKFAQLNELLSVKGLIAFKEYGSNVRFRIYSKAQYEAATGSDKKYFSCKTPIAMIVFDSKDDKNTYYFCQISKSFDEEDFFAIFDIINSKKE